MAVTARVATAFATTGVTISTGFTAVVLTIPSDRFGGVNRAKTGFTGTFDQRCGCHEEELLEIPE